MTARADYPLLAQLEQTPPDTIRYPFRDEVTFALDEIDRLRVETGAPS